MYKKRNKDKKENANQIPAGYDADLFKEMAAAKFRIDSKNKWDTFQFKMQESAAYVDTLVYFFKNSARFKTESDNGVEKFGMILDYLFEKDFLESQVAWLEEDVTKEVQLSASTFEQVVLGVFKCTRVCSQFQKNCDNLNFAVGILSNPENQTGQNQKNKRIKDLHRQEKSTKHTSDTGTYKCDPCNKFLKNARCLSQHT